MADTQQAQSTPPSSAQSLGLPTLNPEDSPYKPLDLPQQEVRTPPPQPENKPPDNLGAVSHAGAAAYLIDNVLRGASRGVAIGQQYAADQYNKKLSAVQSLYNDQAQQLYTMAKEGRAGTFSGPPGKDGKPTFVESPEFSQAKGRMLVAWQAMMDTVGQRIPQGKKGKKGGGGQGGGQAVGAGGPAGQGMDPAMIQQALDHQGDPQGSLAAIYQIGRSIGPPVVHQVAGFLTPEYIEKQQQAATTQRTQAQTEGTTAQNQLDVAKAQATKNRVLLIPENQRTDKDKQDLSSAEDILAPGAKPSAAVYKEYASLADPSLRQWFDVTKETPQGWTAVAVGAGANRAPKEGWTKIDGRWGSQLYDPNTNQPIPGTFNTSKVPPANVQNLFPRENTFRNFFVDSNGVRQEYTSQNTSQRNLPPGLGQTEGGGGGGAAAGAGGGGTAPRTMVTPNPKGLVEPGNIPIDNRPVINNADGTHSSEYSVSFADDNGREVLVPTVVNGRFLTPDGKKPKEGSAEEKAMFKAAWEHYKQTGENLGKFDNASDADAYAQQLHNRGNKPSPGARPATRSATPSGAPRTGGGPGGSLHPIAYQGSVEYKNLIKQATDAKKQADGVLANYATMVKTSVAAKQGSGPAQVGILAAYLKSVVGGQGTGVRITKAEWDAATNSRPWLKGITARFSPDGYLSGTALAPSQIDQMINEVHQRSKSLLDTVATTQQRAEDQKRQDMEAGGLVPPPPSGGFDWKAHPVAK